MKKTTVYFDSMADEAVAISDGKWAIYQEEYVIRSTFNPIGKTRAEIKAHEKVEIASRLRAKRNSQAMKAAMDSIGMVRARGAVSGMTYWE